MRHLVLPLLLAACGTDTDDLEARLTLLQDDLDALQASHDELLSRAEALEAATAPLPGRLTGVEDELAAVAASVPDRLHAVVRSQSFGDVPPGVHVVYRVDCEDGEVAVGGGAGFEGNAGAEELQQSYPGDDLGRLDDGEVPTSWWSILKNHTATTLVGRGYAVCARL